MPLSAGDSPGFPSHCHSFYEISYTIDGDAQYEFENRKITAAPGTLLFLPPLSMHSIKKDYRRQHLLLQFSPRLISSSLSSHHKFDMLTPAGDFAQNGFIYITPDSCLHQCLQVLVRTSPKVELLSDETERRITSYHYRKELCYSAAVLSFLSLLIEEGMLAVAANTLNMSELSKMQMLLSRLVSSPEEKLSMEDAAAFVNMSYSNFCRTFRSTIGCSYVDFCNSIRVRRAQELLLHSNMSVTEISVFLNFGSISYFNRIFKKHTGCTPLSYRTAR